ncbi:MAG: adenylate kinase family protein [Verrucomicrobiales bacterium]
MKRLILLGPPASGKGTQGNLIEAALGVPTCSTGALLRDEIAADTVLGREAGKYLSKGQLLPDDLMLAAVRGWIERRRGGFILDGFPRTLVQAGALDELLAGWSLEIDAALYLDVSEEVLEERILHRVQCTECRAIFRLGDEVADIETPCPSCGGSLHRRKDDTPETLQLRLEEYRQKTAPLLGFYRDRGNLFRINGDQSSQSVFKEIERVIGKAESKQHS